MPQPFEATKFQNAHWDDNDPLGGIILWGITPMKRLLQLMDAYIEENLDEDDEEVMVFFRYEFEDKINGIEEAIYRAIKKLKKKQGKPELKEAA